MSTHDDIVQEIRRKVEEVNKAKSPDLSPDTIATLVYSVFATGTEDVHIRHGCMESYKSMSRRVLAREFGADEDPGMDSQGDMFSGQLQERYPIRTPAGSDPVYRIREALSDSDLEWNIQRLMKLSHAALKHAEALAVYRLTRQQMSSAA